MTSINTNQRPMTMPQNCGMKGMHESHANHTKNAEATAVEQAQKTELVKDPKVGNKFDVLA